MSPATVSQLTRKIYSAIEVWWRGGEAFALNARTAVEEFDGTEFIVDPLSRCGSWALPRPRLERSEGCWLGGRNHSRNAFHAEPVPRRLQVD